MQFNGTQKTVGDRPFRILSDSGNESKIYEFNSDKRTPKLLRCWGNDYPYIVENGNGEKRWLPVLVTSEVPRLRPNKNP